HAPFPLQPVAGSKVWQWVLIMGLAALVCSLLVVAWQRSNPPEVSVISPGASPKPKSEPIAGARATSTGATTTAKPAEGSLSLDDIPVYQAPARTRTEPNRESASSPAEPPSSPEPAAKPEPPRKPSKPEVDLSNPYR